MNGAMSTARSRAMTIALRGPVSRVRGEPDEGAGGLTRETGPPSETRLMMQTPGNRGFVFLGSAKFAIRAAVAECGEEEGS